MAAHDSWRCARRPRAPAPPARPGPGAGTMTSFANTSLTASVSSSRRRPASASSVASYSPRCTFSMRVGTLPRMSTMSRSGPQRHDLRPTPQRRRAEPRAGREIGEVTAVPSRRAPRAGSSRESTAPSASPSGCSVGRSFRLCTAKSIVRPRRPSSSSRVNRPRSPILRQRHVRDPVAERPDAAHARTTTAATPAPTARSRARSARARAGWRACRRARRRAQASCLRPVSKDTPSANSSRAACSRSWPSVEAASVSLSRSIGTCSRRLTRTRVRRSARSRSSFVRVPSSRSSSSLRMRSKCSAQRESGRRGRQAARPLGKAIAFFGDDGLDVRHLGRARRQGLIDRGPDGVERAERHAGHIAGRGLDVARQGEVEHHERPRGRPRHRLAQHIGRDHRPRRARRREHDVGLGERLVQPLERHRMAAGLLRRGPRRAPAAVGDRRSRREGDRRRAVRPAGRCRPRRR